MAMVVDPDGVERGAILELVDLRGKQLVDVGCGDGRLSFVAAEERAEVFAFDPDEESIALARAETPRALEARIQFEVADAAEIDLPQRKFDPALFSWSL